MSGYCRTVNYANEVGSSQPLFGENAMAISGNAFATCIKMFIILAFTFLKFCPHGKEQFTKKKSMY